MVEHTKGFGMKERPRKRELKKDSPYLEYDKGFNHACMLWEKFIEYCTEFKKEKGMKEKKE